MDTNYVKVVENYRNLVNGMDSIIKESGFKSSYLADNLNLSRSAFYIKRKKGTFTILEMEQLTDLIARNEPVDDEVLANIEKARREGKYRVLNSLEEVDEFFANPDK
ncbi:MAG: hypothetical protein LBK22_06835 [Tannerella sp.]|jgi:hypothetical protein|nr:hypothetical protein [Tannerella sp.]